MMTECQCGEPLFEWLLACPACGARNPDYEGFGWGRRITTTVACLLPSLFVPDYGVLEAAVVGTATVLAFRGLDRIRLARARRRLRTNARAGTEGRTGGGRSEG